MFDKFKNYNNKYINWYIKLIESRLTFSRMLLHKETHHILPKSMGGKDSPENLIDLTPREHYIAHLLLARGTDLQPMVKALHKMVFSNSKQNRVKPGNSKIYEYLRIAHSKFVSEYSKNTVTCTNVETGIISRVPCAEFELFKNSKYVAVNKSVPVQLSVKIKKSQNVCPYIIKINGKEYKSLLELKLDGYKLSSKHLDAIYNKTIRTNNLYSTIYYKIFNFTQDELHNYNLFYDKIYRTVEIILK